MPECDLKPGRNLVAVRVQNSEKDPTALLMTIRDEMADPSGSSK